MESKGLGLHCTPTTSAALPTSLLYTKCPSRTFQGFGASYATLWGHFRAGLNSSEVPTCQETPLRIAAFILRGSCPDMACREGIPRWDAGSPNFSSGVSGSGLCHPLTLHPGKSLEPERKREERGK